MTPNSPNIAKRELRPPSMVSPSGHDPKHPDMSPDAITARLKMVEQLRKLCVSLRAAGLSIPARSASDGVLH